MRNEAWVIVDEAIAFVVVIAVEHAILCLEEGVDGSSPAVRRLEWRNIIVVHEESEVSLTLRLVDEPVPYLEWVQAAACVEDPIEN